jgi:hypothetical protein
VSCLLEFYAALYLFIINAMKDSCGLGACVGKYSQVSRYVVHSSQTVQCPGAVSLTYWASDNLWRTDLSFVDRVILDFGFVCERFISTLEHV